MMDASMDAIDRIGLGVNEPPIENHRWRNKGINDDKRNLLESEKTKDSFFDMAQCENSNESIAMKSEDVFFDLNDRWQRAYMQELNRNSPTSKASHMILLCPDDVYNPAATILSDEEIIVEKQSPPRSPLIVTSASSSSSTFTKEFLRGTQSRRPSKAMVDDGEKSPCSVIDAPIGDSTGHVYSWHRGLAWNEEEGDYVAQEQNDQDQIRDFLSIPTRLGREYTREEVVLMNHHPRLQSQKSQRMEEAYRHHELTNNIRTFRKSISQTTMLEQVDLDYATPVHWEGSILSPSHMAHLELMADLTI